jgi:hypothetical protein
MCPLTLTLALTRDDDERFRREVVRDCIVQVVAKMEQEPLDEIDDRFLLISVSLRSCLSRLSLPVLLACDRRRPRRPSSPGARRSITASTSTIGSPSKATSVGEKYGRDGAERRLHAEHRR